MLESEQLMREESSSGVQKLDEEADLGCERCEADGRLMLIGIGVAESSGAMMSGFGDFGKGAESSVRKGSESSSWSDARSFESNLSMRRIKLLKGTASSSSMLYFSVRTLRSANIVVSADHRESVERLTPKVQF